MQNEFYNEEEIEIVIHGQNDEVNPLHEECDDLMMNEGLSNQCTPSGSFCGKTLAFIKQQTAKHTLIKTCIVIFTVCVIGAKFLLFDADITTNGRNLQSDGMPELMDSEGDDDQATPPAPDPTLLPPPPMELMLQQHVQEIPPRTFPHALSEIPILPSQTQSQWKEQPLTVKARDNRRNRRIRRLEERMTGGGQSRFRRGRLFHIDNTKQTYKVIKVEGDNVTFDVKGKEEIRTMNDLEDWN